MTAPVELRDAADIASWLAVGLALRRIAPPEAITDAIADATADAIAGAIAADDERIGRAIAACANELPALPPPGVIADLASLLAGARPVTGAQPAGGGEALRAAIRAYDDDVIARLTQVPQFDDALAAYAHADPADHGAAVALVVAAVCERAGFTGLAVSPAGLRRALARPAGERAVAGLAGLADGPEHPAVRTLAEAYLRLARGARQRRTLLDEREVFAIDHLRVLRDLGGRMTATHLGAAADAIAQRLPRRLPGRRELRGLIDTRLADDTLYPAGGFASITPGGATTGNIENLVTSELVYMDDPADGGAGDRDPIDLFSIRYVEGELLHYTRDDSVFRRHRHLICVALGADLDDARIKDRDLPWQRLILALGLVIASVRWLADQLGDEALTVHVGFPPRLLAEEHQIVALLLEAEIARGTVVISEERWQDTVARAASSSGAIADLVVISLGDTPELPKSVRALHVDLAAISPVVSELAPRRGEASEPPHDPWFAWCVAAEDLLRWLV
jgi:hypothetical protein